MIDVSFQTEKQIKNNNIASFSFKACLSTQSIVEMTFAKLSKLIRTEHQFREQSFPGKFWKSKIGKNGECTNQIVYIHVHVALKEKFVFAINVYVFLRRSVNSNVVRRKKRL